MFPENSGFPDFGPDNPFWDRKIENFKTQACDPSLEMVGPQDPEKKYFESIMAFWAEIWVQIANFGPKSSFYTKN